MKTGAPDLRGAHILIVGAGVFGSAIALELRRAGASIQLIEARLPPDNASSIAAGMLAPAFEAALDPQGASFALLRAARDLWPDVIEGLGPTGFERCGARMEAPGETLARLASAFSQFGAAFESASGGIFTPEDWRLDPALALRAMMAEALGTDRVPIISRVIGADLQSVTLENGQFLEADAVVLACGYGGLDLAPELSALIPIKGQIVRFPGASFFGGPILRSESGYLVPGWGGALAGTTMQTGRSDRVIDPDVTARLVAQAIALAPVLAGVETQASAAVRPATSDGLPMIGQSQSGVWLATGARRNGWLLAPMAARLIAGGLTGQAGDGRFAPSRFQPL